MSEINLEDWPVQKDFPGTRPPKNRTQNGSASATVSSDDPLTALKGRVYRIKGIEVELFTIGQLACLLGKKPVTIRMWESRGWIPLANWRSPKPQGEQIPGKPVKGRRLYSRKQVELLYSSSLLFNIDEKGKSDWPAFREHIKANWLQ